MDREDVIEGIVDILDMSEMSVEVDNNIIKASLDDKKFKITVEEID